jgi:glycerophosphoryl diester phosphodiesterase
MIELDVQLSRDDELVVMHDLRLERTTTGQGLVREHDLSDLRRFDAGSWFSQELAGERVLSLSELIVLVAGRARLNVEIKSAPADWDVLARRLVLCLRAEGQLESTVISCFEPRALQAVRAQAAEAQLGLLWEDDDCTEAWRWTDELRAVSIHPFWKLATHEFTRTAHAHRLRTLVWTVNDVRTMRKLLRRQVDGIISDFPERFCYVDHSGANRTA